MFLGVPCSIDGPWFLFSWTHLSYSGSGRSHPLAYLFSYILSITSGMHVSIIGGTSSSLEGAWDSLLLGASAMLICGFRMSLYCTRPWLAFMRCSMASIVMYLYLRSSKPKSLGWGHLHRISMCWVAMVSLYWLITFLQSLVCPCPLTDSSLLHC